MGQMSKMRKIFRMIKEIKELVGHQMNANRRAALIEYVPLFFWLTFRSLVDSNGNKEIIFHACQVMKDLNVTMDTFKEHILSLMMCGEEQEFAELSTAVKSSFTKTYN